MFGRALGAGCVVAVLLVAGCAEEAGPGGDSTPTANPTATATPTATPEPTATPTPGPVELTGVPEAGVEAGCWLIDGHLLLGGDKDLLASGQPLRVTGTIEHGVMTTCQQGTAFRVDTVEPLN